MAGRITTLGGPETENDFFNYTNPSTGIFRDTSQALQDQFRDEIKGYFTPQGQFLNSEAQKKVNELIEKYKLQAGQDKDIAKKSKTALQLAKDKPGLSTQASFPSGVLTSGTGSSGTLTGK